MPQMSLGDSGDERSLEFFNELGFKDTLIKKYLEKLHDRTNYNSREGSAYELSRHNEHSNGMKSKIREEDFIKSAHCISRLKKDE
jgi:hypothetical protein